MSKKFSAARRAAFLRALAESGNQTLSAERAKVSRSWVVLTRKEDPGFDAAVREAVAAAKDRLGMHGARKPPSGWGHLDGAQLVVRGTGGSGGGKRVQIARARLKQWDPATEDRFIAALRATCNVKAACAEVGMWPPSAYSHRERWPAFAERWKAAEVDGSVRLEFGLIEYFGNPFSTVDAARSLRLLHMHKHAVHGLGRRPGGHARPPTIEEVTKRIVRKVEAIKRARGLSAADKARQRRDFARRRSSG